MVVSIASLMTLDTSSTTNWVSSVAWSPILNLLLFYLKYVNLILWNSLLFIFVRQWELRYMVLSQDSLNHSPKEKKSVLLTSILQNYTITDYCELSKSKFLQLVACLQVCSILYEGGQCRTEFRIITQVKSSLLNQCLDILLKIYLGMTAHISDSV